MTGRRVSGPGTDWVVVNECDGGVVVTVVVGKVEGNRVDVPLERLAFIANEYCKFFCFKTTSKSSDINVLVAGFALAVDLFDRR